MEVIAFYPLERMEEAPDKGLEAGASELVVIGPQRGCCLRVVEDDLNGCHVIEY